MWIEWKSDVINFSYYIEENVTEDQFPKVSPGGQISNPIKENQRKKAGVYDTEILSGLRIVYFNLEFKS